MYCCLYFILQTLVRLLEVNLDWSCLSQLRRLFNTLSCTLTALPCLSSSTMECLYTNRYVDLIDCGHNPLETPVHFKKWLSLMVIRIHNLLGVIPRHHVRSRTSHIIKYSCIPSNKTNSDSTYLYNRDGGWYLHQVTSPLAVRIPSW